MFHRRSRAQGSSHRQLPFEDNVADLLFTNELSAARCQELLKDARAQGCKHLGRLTRRGTDKNIKRSLHRALSRNCGWPPVYNAPVRVWDTKGQCEMTVQLPLLLPHEVVAAFAEKNDCQQLFEEAGMCAASRRHLDCMKSSLSATSLLGVGFWLDGCPCNWDRTESLEVLTMSFPGLVGANRNLRVPLAALPKRFQLHEHTWDDIMQIQRWSLEWLFVGEYPPCRHDGVPFMGSSNGAWRKRRAGKSLQAFSYKSNYMF